MQHEQKKIALFVDFDNIYLGLLQTSREAAEAFATRPHVWLRWIELGMPMESRRPDAPGPRENRVLIRRCYLNPDTFGKYRAYFTRSGFSVVDCPTLTSRGKNSSDIVMVMDILDALRHETHFDRFVIMSADADFTPVLQRLRAHDRRTAVLVSGQAAPAYRAACDRLISEDAFIELALEIAPAPEPQRGPSAVPAPAAPATAATVRDPELLAAMGRRIYEEASSSGTLSASELPRILREFREFTPTSNWLGYYSLQSLTEAILSHRPDLRITDDDPWRIAVQGADEPVAEPAAAEPGASWDAIRDRVVELVARMVAESPDPVVMGRAAHVAIQEAGPMITETRWLGNGTFKNLLLSAPALPFQVVAYPLPGYLFDPARHPAPADRAAVDGLAELGDEMASLIRRIHQLTDAPKLTPRQYRVLFRVMAKELGRAPYSLMSTGKAVRDQCVERGEPIARQSITNVLRGLSYAGYRFGDGEHRAEELAHVYRGNVLNLLRQAQVTLTDDELRMLDEWLAAGPQEPSAPDAQPTETQSVSADAPAAPSAEPDYAAWAEAILAQGSAHHPAAAVTGDDAPRPEASTDEAPASADPELVAEADAPAPDERQPGSADAIPADASPSADAPGPEPWAWAPADERPAEPARDPWLADVIEGAQADRTTSGYDPFARPEADAPENEEAAPPADVTDPDPALADAIPAELSDDHGPLGPDDVPAEWEMSDEAGADASAPDPEHADAIPAELSDDHGPLGPDDVPAEWEMSDEPPAAEHPHSDAGPAEAAGDGDPLTPDIVPAEWQAAADQPAESDAPAEGEIVDAAWEAAPPAEADQPQAAAPVEPEAPEESDIFTAAWEPADAPAVAPEPGPQSSSDAVEPPREAPAGGVVTPRWEEVEQGGWPSDAPADAPSEPAAQMDAFPSEPAHDPPPEDTPEGEAPAEQPSWWQ